MDGIKYETVVYDLSKDKEPLFDVEIKNPLTGEIRTIRATSLESAFRSLGRTYDNDLKKGLPL
jgi:hypothetical protein